MFQKDNTVMVLVDVQGKLSQLMYEKEKMFSAVSAMIKSMQILEVPIIWMEQIPEKLGKTTPEIAECIQENAPIAKSSFSCCGEPAFMEAFKKTGRTQVLLAGIETHICVFQTAYDLINKGYQVQVAADCVSSRTRENKDVGLQRIIQTGGRITSLEMAIFELLGKAEGEEFKQVVKLIK